LAVFGQAYPAYWRQTGTEVLFILFLVVSGEAMVSRSQFYTILGENWLQFIWAVFSRLIEISRG
jgi:hypothetical protein